MISRDISIMLLLRRNLNDNISESITTVEL